MFPFRHVLVSGNLYLALGQKQRNILVISSLLILRRQYVMLGPSSQTVLDRIGYNSIE